MSATNRLEFIASTQLTAGSSMVTFDTGLDGFSKFFMVCFTVKNTTQGGIRMRFNNDGAANYATQILSADGAVKTGARAAGAGEITFTSVTFIAASSVGLTVVEISKPVAGEVARVTARTCNDSNSGIDIELCAGEWTNSAALITRIDILAPGPLGLASGSRYLLYGSKD